MDSLIVTVPLSAIPSLVLLFYFRHLDKQKKEAWSPVFKLFFLGIVSIIPAAILELILVNQTLYIQGTIGNLIKAFIIAGFIEEFLKLQTVRLFAYKKQYFDEITDGIVYTIAASLGFAFFENIIYAIGAGNEVILLRAFTAVPLHAIASGIMGYYIGLSKFTYKNHMFKGLIYAVFIHGLYNFILFEPSIPVIFIFPLLIIGFIVLRILFNKALMKDKEEDRS